MNKRYFQLEKTGDVANLTIYGDVTSWPINKSDVSSFNLSRQLSELQNVKNINVYISSYGGEVREGLAIYNALKRHPAHVTTYCDGFACSISSVIFMAGDDRVMAPASLLMIHNAWTYAEGNAKEMRKMAEDLDKITSASVAAYMEHITLSETQLKHKMDAETWITPEEALEWGFATKIGDDGVQHTFSQSARKCLMELVQKAMQAKAEDDENEDVEAPENPQEDPEQPDNHEEPENENDSGGNDDEPEPEETPDDEEEDEEEAPDPAQRWSGFFNAISRV